MDLREREVACSGMPYTAFEPGKVKSRATAVGPKFLLSFCPLKSSSHQPSSFSCSEESLKSSDKRHQNPSQEVKKRKGKGKERKKKKNAFSEKLCLCGHDSLFPGREFLPLGPRVLKVEEATAVDREHGLFPHIKVKAEGCVLDHDLVAIKIQNRGLFICRFDIPFSQQEYPKKEVRKEQKK